MEIKRVKDIMIPLDNYPHVPCWYTLRQAMEEMEKYHIESGGRMSLPRVILIFDLDSSLCGIVRRRDIMRGLEPDFLANKPLDYQKKLFDVTVDPNLTELTYDNVFLHLQDQAERPVSEVMVPVKATVDYEDHIMRVIYEMVTNDRSLIPVVKGRTIVGVVRSVEVYREIIHVVFKSKTDSE
ncbi:MAG: CBS domain-containing protein [Candidatus Omnitrophica bacterium]|nr:CBS domain-containing protein [Candidatus Omnitrophota bacterium]